MAEGHSKKSEISVLNWIGTLILSILPGINLILFIIWAFSCKRVSKRNFAIASLILIAFFIVAAVVACALWGGTIITWFENLSPESLSGIVPTPSPAA